MRPSPAGARRASFPARVEVLVVGGGPAGSTAAALLARAGRDVLLLERRREGEGKVCGEFISSEAVPVLRHLGLLDELREAGALPIRCVRVRSAVDRFDAELPTVGAGPGFALSRATLDRVLLAAAGHSGARLLSGARLQHLSGPAASGRQAELRVSGRFHWVTARLVIGADGRESSVARLAGLPACASEARLGLRLHFGRSGSPPDRVELLLLERSYAGLVPVEGHRWCLGALVPPPGGGGRNPFLLLLNRCSEASDLADLRGSAGEGVSRRATYPVRIGYRKAVAPGILMAGDAAGIVDPFCGQGIALALITGAAAAAAAHRMLDAGIDTSVVGRSYSAFLRRLIGGRLSACGPLRRLMDHPGLSRRAVGFLSRHSGAARILVGLTRKPLEGPGPEPAGPFSWLPPS